MSKIEVNKEMWPVMLTPFTGDGSIDYTSLEKLIQWYQENGADGLFAVCQSSEMFFLSLNERISLAKFIKEHANIPVIASGHTSYSTKDQVEELKHIAQTGVDAVILISNRLDIHGQDDLMWKKNLDYILKNLDESIPLGFYECPHPYKRLLSLDELKFMADSKRFLFIKDTCCDINLIQKRVDVIKNSSLRLFNANTSTLLNSLKCGGAGFSGVMANFHPQLYSWLLKNWDTQPEKAQTVQAFLSVCSQIEKQYYPVNAKFHLQSVGIFSDIFTRSVSANSSKMTPLFKDEVIQMHSLAHKIGDLLDL